MGAKVGNLQIGDQVAYLTLIKHVVRPTDDRIVWECQCECGNIVYRRNDYLVSRPDKQSCGCRHPIHGKYVPTGKNHFQWKGVGDIPKQYYWNLRKNAETRGYKFEITLEQMWEKFLEQDGKCVLTDIPLVFCPTKQQRKGNGEQTASMDRIDPLKGYTIDNVRWVHKHVNKMKMEFNDEQFIDMCRLVAAKFQA